MIPSGGAERKTILRSIPEEKEGGGRRRHSPTGANDVGAQKRMEGEKRKEEIHHDLPVYFHGREGVRIGYRKEEACFYYKRKGGGIKKRKKTLSQRGEERDAPTERKKKKE